MCGILTYFKAGGLTKEDIEQSLDALNVIKHRGPDGEGVLLINTATGKYTMLKTQDTPGDIPAVSHDQLTDAGSYDLLLGHRRLSILDLSSRGHQPFLYQELAITYNGEVYNYVELREILKQHGYTFSTGTDTEVIAAAYRHWGTDCFSKFNGMWTMVMYDLRNGQMIISNDRYGVKPLYYRHDKDEILLISEPKQVKAYKKVKRGINPVSVEAYMNWGYVLFDDQTFFDHVMRFPNSHYYKLNIRTGNISFQQGPERYYTLSTAIVEPPSEKEAMETFRHLLTDAVKIRLRSDVKLGISLSGGLDSTSIAFIAKDMLDKDKFITFSVIGEKGTPEDESYFINLANQKLGSHNVQIDPRTEFNEESFIRHIYQMGAPVTDTSFFAQYRLKKVIRENDTTVLLSGQGGDETLAGYHHHFLKYASQLVSEGKFSLAKKEIHLWSQMKGRNPKDIYNTVLKDIYLIWKTRLGLARLPMQMQRDVFRINRLNDFLQADFSRLQMPYFLQADDRFSMAYGIEVRNPFLDYRLVDYAFSLPDRFKIRDGWQKWILREAVPEMPDEIRYRKDKKGFTTPMKLWLDQNNDMLIRMAEISDQQFPEYASKTLFRRACLGAWIKSFRQD